MANTPIPRDKSSNRIILIATLVIILSAAGLYLYAGWVGYQEAPKISEAAVEGCPIMSAIYPGNNLGSSSIKMQQCFILLR
jgi:hypothetical protein